MCSTRETPIIWTLWGLRLRTSDHLVAMIVCLVLLQPKYLLQHPTRFFSRIVLCLVPPSLPSKLISYSVPAEEYLFSMMHPHPCFTVCSVVVSHPTLCFLCGLLFVLSGQSSFFHFTAFATLQLEQLMATTTAFFLPLLHEGQFEDNQHLAVD